MSDLKVFEWNKKVRTVLRSIRPGDIFMFELEPKRFATGRIMSKVDFGHVAEILNYFPDSPQISAETLRSAKRVIPPVVLDSYTLFDKKLAGDWRIVAHEEDYSASPSEQVFFGYGAGASFKKVDMFGNEISVAKSEAEKLPSYSPKQDWDMRELVAPYLK